MDITMEEHRCVICGKILHDPLAIYCSECEYELKRARLSDEESLEEWLERMKEANPYYHSEVDHTRVKSLDNWF